MEKMVQKSVRIPAALVEFVSGQPGGCFLQKLVSVLSECRDGETERSLMLQRYDEQIAERKQRLGAMIADINRVSLVHRRVLDLIKYVESAELAGL